MAKMFFYCPRTSSLAGQILLEWCGHAYHLCRVPYPELHGDDYTKINPRGKVPALKIGDRVIRENIAILTYLARRARTPLMADPGTPAADEQLEWLSFVATEISPLFLMQFGVKRFATSEATEADLTTNARVQLRGKLAELDAQIGERTNIVGDRKSVVDALFFPMLRWCDSYLDFEQDYANIYRFQQAMLADEGVKRALAVESSEVSEIETGGALRKHIVISELFAEPPPKEEPPKEEAAETAAQEDVPAESTADGAAEAEAEADAEVVEATEAQTIARQEEE